MDPMTHGPLADVSLPHPPAAPRRRAWIVLPVVLGVVAAAAAATGYYFLAGGDPEDDPKPRRAVLAVNTTRARRITLVRTLDQAGSILPHAQAELYAKASGYLRALGRETTPETAAAVVQALLAGPAGAPLPGVVARGCIGLAVAMDRAPSVDIGSPVAPGDLLADIDVPERVQEVVEREAMLAQREQELAQARTVVGSFEAAVEVAKAHRLQAEADVKRYQSEHNLRKKELVRVKELVRSGALEGRVADEKQAQVEAAQGALESSAAKVTGAKAELALASSKLATAKADVKVKEAIRDVAQTDVERARIAESYGRLHAPFRGIVTYRGVDEGDFVQNSRTGQSRHLMTVTAIHRVKMGLKVPSAEGVLVRPGTEAVVTVDSRPGERFYGRVSRTRGVLDVQSRTLEVEIDLDNRDHRLMPGMYGHVTLTLTAKPDTPVVPATALFSRKKVNYVLLVRDGVARRQPVRIVFDGGDQIEVVQLIGGREVPLDGSEELIVSSKGEIADGQRVRTPSP